MFEEFVSALNYLQAHYEEDVQIGIKYKPNLKDSNEYLNLLTKTKDTDILFEEPQGVPTGMIWRCFGAAPKPERLVHRESTKYLLFF